MLKDHRSTARRTLGLAVLSGLALAAAPAAHAATHAPDSTGNDDPSMTTVHEMTEGLTTTPLYPIAGSPFDLLSNNVRVPVGGMDLSTFPVTAPFRNGLPLRDVPVVGALLP